MRQQEKMEMINVDDIIEFMKPILWSDEHRGYTFNLKMFLEDSLPHWKTKKAELWERKKA
jgi:hypothetical protein